MIRKKQKENIFAKHRVQWNVGSQGWRPYSWAVATVNMKILSKHLQKNKQNVHNQKVIKRRNRTNSCANVIHAIRSTNMWAASKNQLRITRTNRKCCFSVTFFQQLLKIKSQKAKKTKSKQTGKQTKFRTILTIDIVFPIRFRFQMTYTQSLYFATPSLTAANIKHHQETVMEQEIATFFL